MSSHKRSFTTVDSPNPPKKKANHEGARQEAFVSFNYHQRENTTLHHTEDYENKVLVLRRGFNFKLSLTLENFTEPETRDPELRFSIPAKNRDIKFRPWESKLISDDFKEKHFEITIPVNAAIGRYKIEVVFPNYSSRALKQTGEIIVLFNAWNKDDEVFVADDASRNEYVLRDYGIIYAGWSRYRGPNPARWNFGQFEENILDCVLYLLENDQRIKKKPMRSLFMRSSSVWMARILSAMINSQDDQGVLMGNWSGNYEDGKSPTEWNGSVNILQEYYKTKRPVKYGQCWVFSGVMTTALRAIGIPARSTTNYNSAHDTDNTMTIDKFIDEEGDSVDHLERDSIWNFHVWNEIWTKRSDLPDSKYDGWQAVDATPQEESSKIYQMGPAPLKAVKEGEIYAGFDTGFVYAEVNADSVTWVVKKDRNYGYVIQKASSRSERRVGSYISTKQVGGWQREDITHLYKYPEGSGEERKSFETAYSFGDGAKDFAGHLNVEEEGHELEIDLDTKEEDLRVGKPITCIITAKNISNEDLTVNLTGVINSIKYTGFVWSLVEKRSFKDVKISSGKSVTKEIVLQPDEYVKKLVDLNCFKFVVVAKVLESNKFYVDETKFQLFNEDAIQVKFDKLPLQVGETSGVQVSFTNPLSIRLSYIKISIEGAGLLYLDTKTYRKSLEYNETHTAKFYFKPRKAGKRTLLVDVDTSQVKDFKAAVDVDVLPPYSIF